MELTNHSEKFQITPKAKRFALSLLIIGGVLSILGIILGAGDEHFLTRIMTNGLINAFFFFAIGLGALFFLALNYATEAGWYAVIKRIVESVALYLPYGIGVLGGVLLLITVMKGAHIYIWMDEEVVKEDHIIQGKSAYLNIAFFWIRTLAYFAVYLIFLRGFRKRSLLEDEVGGTEIHFKNYRKGATFLVFFAVFSSTSAWDWLMSIDVHWFSTLFGWYTFAGMWVSAMVVIVLTIIYLKKLGYLPQINESHIHDVGKWIFAISFLWSYLWFSQYMLIWYANIGEEVAYYVMRTENFKVLYFGMFLINFIFPMLILMSRDAKRDSGILMFVGIIILLGHWLDVYIMVSAGSLGVNAQLGILELGMLLLMAGAFIMILLKNLTKAPLLPVHHPFLDESIHHEF